ncbi:hypothetical protein [Streptomyces sp. NPDC102476]|uniref:hypothetical protein n=1 Tax=Streptomyces sp. NPDC102476 TaxID=3366181 RepID=UPI0037F4BCA1
MIPIVRYEPTSQIPEQASFWMPTEDDIPDDEGLGYFRDVWMILNMPMNWAQRIVETEATYIELVDRIARSVDECEAVANIVEYGEIDRDVPSSIRARLEAEVPEILDRPEDGDPPLGNLELGVAGLSYVLSSVGAVPVASCRGHINGWSDQPVVYAAVDEQRALWLQPLVAESGCGFHIGVNREEFLAIDGPSIRHTNQLADAIQSKFGGRVETFDRWLDLDVIDSRYD